MQDVKVPTQMDKSWKKKALYIGLMSGTSLDAIDAILMDFSDTIHVLATKNIPLPQTLRDEILALNTPQHNELTRSLVMGKKLAHLFSAAVIELLKDTGITKSQIIAIGSHGQTLRHAPLGEFGYSLQIGDPSTIAELTGITVVADFRNRDIAAGGQGAPLVPAFHQAAFGSAKENRAIINIGGMANVSIFLTNGTIQGFDTGPGNVLMNHWTQQHINQSYDHNGEWAKSGKINNTLLTQMLQEPFFNIPPPKSTGRELFDAHWLDQYCLASIKPEDIQATLLELTAITIVHALPDNIDTLFVCGGGAYNLQLMARIAAISGKPTLNTQTLGIAPEWVEAAAFAWLAQQTINYQPGNLPAATGAKGLRILGGIYPGNT
jgi:anhydro-N-acetylmuramic acid kinase